VTRPTAPIEVDAYPQTVGERLSSPRVQVDDVTLERLRSVCPVDLDPRNLMEAGRDWWPITVWWATHGQVPALPGVLARPESLEQLQSALAVCNEARVPVTPTAGRSGVCGASVPAFGGVALDMCAIAGLSELDETSLLARVLPGTFGPDLEAALSERGFTLGHWPQSMDISTVGGWLSCRSAGQYSTRYGKIEDMVVGLEVVMSDGRTLRTGWTAPRAATGPDLTQLFVGSEGTLGVISSALLRVHPKPDQQTRRAFGFGSFRNGLAACRQILRRGATPAVLRLYDEVESARNFSVDDACVLVVMDEADPVVLEATASVVDDECSECGGSKMDVALVDKWLEHRNDVSALAPLYRAGIVVDTIEISGRWAALHEIYGDAVRALNGVEGTLVASAHQSHAYPDGACLYFTFAGRRPEGSTRDVAGIYTHLDPDELEDAWAQHYYAKAWQSVMDVVVAHGGAISHHHGIGINRARFMGEALGATLEVLGAVKQALDPRGILNPGKLGLPSPFGEIHWPLRA
jgi:alkyldihydroxyacetonephosphate synthase